jgi:hypothetical protein
METNTPQLEPRESNPLNRITRRRPLLHMKTAMFFLDMTEDAVLTAIAKGRIQYAFDLRRAQAKRRYILVASSSVEKLLGFGVELLSSDAAGLEAVISLAVPPRPVFRVVELQYRWGVSQWLLSGLIADNLIEIERPATRRKDSPYVTAASVRRLLCERRVT